VPAVIVPELPDPSPEEEPLEQPDRARSRPAVRELRRVTRMRRPLDRETGAGGKLLNNMAADDGDGLVFQSSKRSEFPWKRHVECGRATAVGPCFVQQIVR
jgi:hypothetical protein